MAQVLGVGTDEITARAGRISARSREYLHSRPEAVDLIRLLAECNATAETIERLKNAL